VFAWEFASGAYGKGSYIFFFFRKFKFSTKLSLYFGYWLTGIYRYTDFLVNEIAPDGSIVHLTDDAAPKFKDVTKASILTSPEICYTKIASICQLLFFWFYQLTLMDRGMRVKPPSV
jgi:hypothetical protein